MSSTGATGLSFTSNITTLSMATPTGAAVSTWDSEQQQNETTGFSNTTNYPIEDGTLSNPNWVVLALVTVMVVALAANLTVGVVVWRSKALHAPFAVLTSLAVSDVFKTLTVMPLSILRLLFGGNLPRWICRLWSQLYLSYAGLTLTHLAMAFLHCHMTLHNPRWYRQMSAPCTAGIQVLVSWLLPVLLALPYVIYSTWTEDPDTIESIVQCLPVYPRYFISGVFPTFIIPALLAGIMYIQVVMTMGIQRRAAANILPEPVSEISSNGFVTYENSEVSSSDEESEKPSKHHHHHQEKKQDENGCVTNDIIQHEVIVHDAMSDNTKVDNTDNDGACCEMEETSSAIVENGTTATPPNVDTPEMMSPTGPDPQQQHEQNTNIICETPSTLVDNELVSCIDTDKDMATDPTCTQATGIVPTLSDAKQKAIDGVIRSTDCSGVSVVLVKAKVGKEALNEPLEDTGIDDVQLQMASFLITNCPSNAEGVENPTFQMDDSDMPLSESIKPKTNMGEHASPIAAKEGSSSESLNVNGIGKNGGTPTGTSRTSSFSGDENGYRSILKWDRAKRSSNKSVTFALHQEHDSQPTTNKPRLLSCKYRTKNGQRIRQGGKVRIPSNTTGSAVVKRPADLPNLPGKHKESLAKSAEIRYIEAQRDPGSRLRARIKRNSRQALLLLVLFVVCMVCTSPYVVTLLVMWFGEGDSQTPQSEPLILFSVLEWLGFMPYIVYPFLYVAFSKEFRKVLKGMVSKTVSAK